LKRIAWTLLVLSGAAASVRAQQPFVSDDAEVTAKGLFHFEYFNQYAELPRTASPDLRQDTNNFTIQYGLLRNLEVNVDFPLIAIDRALESPLASAFGLGDVDLAAKYKLVAEDPNGARPAFAVSLAVELPTGDTSTQLGSGRTDVVLNTVAQKTICGSTVVHFNLGYQFSGNTLTGAIGIPTPGHIVTAGSPSSTASRGRSSWGST
jgi:Putative MetA-pathway of phenol degradation